MHNDRRLDENERAASKSSLDLTLNSARFPNLLEAGCELAARLEAFRGSRDAIVLGIVLGGVLPAREVAKGLALPLDYIIIRRLLAPEGPGSQACAVNVAGSLLIDEELAALPAAPESALDYFISDALEMLARRERLCRAGRAPLDLVGKTILLVDCGIRTGLTMRAAIRALRKTSPARIIAAAPVASPDSRATIEAIADEVVCLKWPEPFGNVAMWYSDFTRPGDDKVSEFLE
jgi:predicted phosphoribosyltransferase